MSTRGAVIVVDILDEIFIALSECMSALPSISMFASHKILILQLPPMYT